MECKVRYGIAFLSEEISNNRTRVECKVISITYSYFCRAANNRTRVECKVLSCAAIALEAYTQIIEPEWNVKKSSSSIIALSNPPNNRTRVECKVFRTLDIPPTGISNNRTRVECKAFSDENIKAIAEHQIIEPEWNVKYIGQIGRVQVYGFK